MPTCSATQNLHHACVRPKRRKITIAILICIAATIVVIHSRDNQPRFEGRKLSEWLALAQEHIQPEHIRLPETPDVEHARNAVNTMGTNALPFLLEWIRYEPASWRMSIARLLPRRFGRSRLIEGRSRQERAVAAMVGFLILGTNATAAIPTLGAMMKDTNHPSAAARTIFALTGVGNEATTILINAFTDPQHQHRSLIVYSLGQIENTNTVLPVLLAGLNDVDIRVRREATNALNRIDQAFLINAPAP